MSFLTVITRTYKRPGLLARNQASLAAQTDPDFEQILLVDDAGRGVAWANAQLRDVAGQISGEYVLVLDDDDRVAADDLIARLKIAAAERPGVIMTRMDHGPRGILPEPEYAGQLPPRAHVGCSAPIVRADIWRACAPAWGAAYDGDYDFVAALFATGTPVVWLPVIATAVQQIGLGQPEL